MNTEWVKVAEVQGLMKAYIIKGRLEAEGIPVKLKYEVIAKIYGLTVDGIGLVEIFVERGYENDATRIIELSESHRDKGI